MVALASYFTKAIALGRGWTWTAKSNVHARGTPQVLGPRCRISIARGASLVMGSNCSFDRDVELVVYEGGRLELGDHVYVGHGTTIACSESIVIGSNTLIGDMVTIRDMNHQRLPGQHLRESGMQVRPVKIGANCWLASKVTVIAGTTLGDDVTVAANAAVSGVFESGITIGGVPARIIDKA